jgi:hypothetical protein
VGSKIRERIQVGCARIRAGVIVAVGVLSINSAVTENGVLGIVNCTILNDLIPGSGRGNIRSPAKTAASVKIRPQARCVTRNEAKFRRPSSLPRPLRVSAPAVSRTPILGTAEFMDSTGSGET